MATKLYELQQEVKKFMVYGERNSQDAILTDEACSELTVYKDLVFNGVEPSIKNVYPLCYRLLKDNWHQIIKEYMQEFPASSPVFNNVSKNFANFLQSKDYGPEYIAELAWYEWLELELYLAEDVKKDKGITPAHMVCNFAFPITGIVEELRKDNLDFEVQKSAEQVLIFRDEQAKKVKFFSLAPTTSIALALLDQGQSIDEIIKAIKESFELDDSLDEKLRIDLEKLMGHLKDKNILLH